MKPAAAALVALALVAAALVLVRDHTRADSLSADEPIHILSGYFAVARGTAIVNIEHPPLMKALAGLALVTLPLAPPPETVPLGNLFTEYAPGFFFGNRVPADRIVAAARAPFLAVLAALLVLVFVAAKSRYGPVPALFATALLALDPTVIAHAGVVHTDLGAALMFLAAVLAWDAAERRPDALRILGAGACLGLALATKFSTVYLVPILFLQALFAARRDGGSGRRLLGGLARLGLAGAAALAVLLAVYTAVTARMNREDQAAIIRDKVGAYGQAPELAERIVALGRVSKPLAHYAGGLASVARQNAVGGNASYLNGRISAEGFPHYFFVAFGVKSTLAFLAVTLAVLFAALRWPRAYAEELRLFGIPVLVLFLASTGATYNIGIRHMLPVYPFLALFGAGVFARVWAARTLSRRAAAAAAAFLALPLVSALETARIHPHELSYFNAFAGGPDAGARILSDSNVDWGLDLLRLRDELARRGVAPEDVTVAYFGGDNVFERLGVPDYSTIPVLRGRYLAISEFLETAGPEFYHADQPMAAALRTLQREAARARPVGRVGHSITLYELPERGAP